MNIFSTIQRFAAYFVAKCRNSWEQKDELHFFFFFCKIEKSSKLLIFLVMKSGFWSMLLSQLITFRTDK